MKALRILNRDRRFAASRLGSVLGSPNARGRGPLSFDNSANQQAPAPEWQELEVLLSGICGSDLALIEGRASAYFDPWVSMPFIPGHEVLARTAEGKRVVIDPVLGHRCRGLPVPDDVSAPADGHDYSHIVAGHLEPGIQTGFCCSAGGGWAERMWAHPSQMHSVPESLSDEQAVLIEPVAGSVHAALIALRSRDEAPLISVIGLGTIGISTVAAVRHFRPDARIVAAGRYPHQMAAARQLGADVVTGFDGLARALRRLTGTAMIGPDTGGGADSTLDCVGSGDTIRASIGTTRPRGRVVVVGMPSEVTVDLAPLWHRETELVGAYTYGTEDVGNERRHSFDHAIDVISSFPSPWLLSATYPLDRHRDALAHAAAAGRRGAFKIAFDLREEN
ncbi:MAG: zinc-dependent alcohol dehydrogenase [Ilumatobacteraceae bacterium]